MRWVCTTFSNGEREIFKISEEGDVIESLDARSTKAASAKKVRRKVAEVELAFDESPQSKKSLIEALDQLKRMVDAVR